MTGIYRVESFERDGRVVPSSFDHPERWREVAIGEHGDNVLVQFQGDSSATFMVGWPQETGSPPTVLDVLWRARMMERTVSFTKPATGILPFLPMVMQREHPGTFTRKQKPDTLRYARNGAGGLTLDGEFDGAILRIRMRRLPLDSLPFFRFRLKPI
jgi:hypothetical protein